MWKQISAQHLEISFQNLIRGCSKDYIFELQMPVLKEALQPGQMNPLLVSAHLQMLDNSSQTVSKSCTLTVSLCPLTDKIQDSQDDPLVLINLLRVKTAEALE